MPRTGRLIVMAPLCGLLAGCGEAPDPTTPEPALSEVLAPAFSASPGRQILMLDACDPASFNEAFGFEICTRVNARAGIPFSTFVELLQKHGRVDAWRFAPDAIHVTRPVTFRVPNLGGIPHSFTRVEAFGGGFVPFLNALSGNPVPAPECVHPANPTAPHPDVELILPGDHGHVTIEPGEEGRYMCCIHPWMRAVSR